MITFFGIVAILYFIASLIVKFTQSKVKLPAGVYALLLGVVLILVDVCLKKMITFFGIVAILYFIASISVKFTQIKVKLPAGVLALLLGMVLIVVDACFVKIQSQEVGIVIKPSGIDDKELHTGWSIIAPWWDVRRLPKTDQVYTFSERHGDGNGPLSDAIWAPTKDGIKMGFDVSFSWAIDAERASWIYAKVPGNDDDPQSRYNWLEDNVIRAKAKSAVALTVSQYTPIEAYSNKRQEIQDVVEKSLKEELLGKGIVLQQVDFREVFYNPEFEKAINNKKLAEQEVLRLVEVTKQRQEELTQAKITKDIEIQKAQGEAEALKIKGSSIASNPKIIQLEAISRWNGVLPQYIMGNNSNTMMMLGDMSGK